MNKKVLIVEDDEQIAHVYDLNLKKLGYETVIVIDGEEGIKKAISEKPGVVLLDLMLQGKDGFWFLEERKKKPEVAKIPVIVLSNLGQEQDRKRAMDLGACNYLVKADIPIKDVIGEVQKCMI